MSDEPADPTPGTPERREDEPGWAVPNLEPRAPQTGSPTAPTTPTAAPVASAPAAPPPPGAPAPTGGWAIPPAGAPAAGAAPRRPRRGWIVVLVVALGVIALFAIAGTVLFVDRSLPPYQAAYDFLDDVTAGRSQASFDRLCASDRGDPESAVDALKRRIDFGDEITVNALSVDRDGDRATVEVIVDPGGSADRRHFDLPMREEGGDWKACPGDLLR